MKDIAGVLIQSINIFNRDLLFARPAKLKFGADAHAHPIAGVVFIADVRSRIRKVVGQGSSQTLVKLDRQADVEIDQITIQIRYIVEGSGSLLSVGVGCGDVVHSTKDGKHRGDCVFGGNPQSKCLRIIEYSKLPGSRIELNSVIRFDAVTSERTNTELLIDLGIHCQL